MKTQSVVGVLMPPADLTLVNVYLMATYMIKYLTTKAKSAVLRIKSSYLANDIEIK